MADEFPLDDTATRSLLERLATRVDGLHDGEEAALRAIREAR